ncbi:MAG: LuxR C-terminal-related transcriptional regulator [Mucinivorans sp.]
MKYSNIFYRRTEHFWDVILARFSFDRNDIIERQRIAIFLLSELGMVLVGIAATFLYKDIKTVFFYINNGVFVLLPIVLFFLYINRVLSLSQALFWHLILYQAAGSSKMMYAAITSTNVQLASGIIILDMTLLLSCFLIAYLSYLRYINIIIVVTSIATYIATIYVLDSQILKNLLPVFCIMFLLYGFFAKAMNKMVSKIFNENKELKIEHTDITHRLERDRKQLEALLLLPSAQPLSQPQMREVLATVGYKVERNLRKKMIYFMEQEHIDYNKLTERLPELSPSEIEICQLILKGKKLKEICRELGKTDTNISSQRSHIRTKLGLLTDENLKTALENRLKTK